MDTPGRDPSDPQTIPGFITSSQQPHHKHPKSNKEPSHFQPSVCVYLTVGSLGIKEATGMPLDGTRQYTPPPPPPPPPHSEGRRGAVNCRDTSQLRVCWETASGDRLLAAVEREIPETDLPSNIGMHRGIAVVKRKKKCLSLLRL